MQKLVSLGKILSDINRVKILSLLQRENELCVCEFCDTLKLSQPLVSRHLKQMREADIVATQQKGKWILYSLKHNTILECILINIKDEIQELPQIVSCTARL